DEWTGEVDEAAAAAIGEALHSTVPGVLEELAKL
ncbi:MAG: N-formylglutamate amidohydrolase, partial [Blastocatellia bacterium]|nr:N-formylglutamate amidohydrolase [Blastocatellia bacterium]